jgi:hypothetical protein
MKTAPIGVRRFSRLALCVGTLVVMLALAAVATADGGALGRQLGKIRAATARFHEVETAQAEGYAQFLGCISEPGEGAMGIHPSTATVGTRRLIAAAEAVI